MSHLQPLDLLRLYHTSKQFHAFLKVPKGSHTTLEWTRARVNVPEYPPCPSWTTEPLFAALCFGWYCQGCATEEDHTVPLWEVGYRYCEECKHARQAVQRFVPLSARKLTLGLAESIRSSTFQQVHIFRSTSLGLHLSFPPYTVSGL